MSGRRAEKSREKSGQKLRGATRPSSEGPPCRGECGRERSLVVTAAEGGRAVKREGREGPPLQFGSRRVFLTLSRLGVGFRSHPPAARSDISLKTHVAFPPQIWHWTRLVSGVAHGFRGRTSSPEARLGARGASRNPSRRCTLPKVRRGEVVALSFWGGIFSTTRTAGPNPAQRCAGINFVTSLG